MDIKTLILLIGGLLIAAVLAHGFYLAWRTRRDGLRMDIQPASSEPFDEMELLRGELPSGGARVRRNAPEQGSLDLDGAAPLLMDTSGAPVAARAANDRVAEVELPGEPITATSKVPIDSGSDASSQSSRRRRPAARPQRSDSPKGAQSAEPGSSVDDGPTDLIVINVLCRNGKTLKGAELLDLLLANGLKFGEMNIYHAKDPLTRATRYSVANSVEPGTFDLSSMDSFETPGITFFMRLPGAEPALEVFEQMHRCAADVARRLDADLLDERRSVLTNQTIAHYRGRITEFYRKRLSRRVV